LFVENSDFIIVFVHICVCLRILVLPHKYFGIEGSNMRHF